VPPGGRHPWKLIASRIFERSRPPVHSTISSRQCVSTPSLTETIIPDFSITSAVVLAVQTAEYISLSSRDVLSPVNVDFVKYDPSGDFSRWVLCSANVFPLLNGTKFILNVDVYIVLLPISYYIYIYIQFVQKNRLRYYVILKLELLLFISCVHFLL